MQDSGVNSGAVPGCGHARHTRNGTETGLPGPCAVPYLARNPDLPGIGLRIRKELPALIVARGNSLNGKALAPYCTRRVRGNRTEVYG